VNSLLHPEHRPQVKHLRTRRGRVYALDHAPAIDDEACTDAGAAVRSLASGAVRCWPELGEARCDPGQDFKGEANVGGEVFVEKAAEDGLELAEGGEELVDAALHV
jgi:hypothetical protein